MKMRRASVPDAAGFEDGDTHQQLRRPTSSRHDKLVHNAVV
jgi:hypothetical protein